MADNDSPYKYVTASGLQSSDIAQLRQLLNEIAPSLGDVLGNAFEKAFGQAFQSNIGMYGGATLPYGSTSLFGPRNAGADFMAWSQDQGIAAAMSESQRTVERLRNEQNQNYLLASGAASTQAQAEAMSRRFTFTGLASNLMFNQLQPAALQRGLEEGSRYMGAGALGWDPMATDDRTDIRMMNTALTEDFLSNPQRYYGLKGADVGRLYAEMGRTGQLSSIRNTSENESDMEARVVEATREASRSIQAFRQIFRGSVTDVLDQVNAMMGVDVMATFDDQGRSLLQNMSAAGSITGFAPQQMAALGGMSRHISKQAGMDPWGSAAVATHAAQIMGVQRLGHRSPLVNQVDFRNDVVLQTTGAQQSGMSRDISGAYAMITQRDGKAAADAFLTKIRAMSPEEALRLDPTSLARLVGEGVTGFDIRDASYTAEAEIARSRGIGTRVAAQHNAASINESRMVMIRNRLETSGVQDVEGIMAALREGPVTEDAMRKAFAGNEGAMSLRGSLMRTFGLQAEALNISGGARGVDQLLGASFDRTRLDNILKQTDTGRMMLETLGGRNVGGGLSGINAYINELGKEGNKGTMQGFVKAALGGDSDITVDDAGKMLGLFGTGTKNLQDYLDKRGLSDVDAGRQQMASVGANLAARTLFTRMYKGEAATDAQMKEARDLLQNFKDDPQALMDYAETVGGDFQSKVAGNVFRLSKGMKDQTLEGNKLNKAAEAITVLQQATTEDKYKSTELQKEEEAKKFKKTGEDLLRAYQDNLKTEKANLDPEAFKRAWFEQNKDTSLKMKQFDEYLEKESQMNEAIGAPGSTLSGIGAIIALLTKITTWMVDEGNLKKNPDASSGGRT